MTRKETKLKFYKIKFSHFYIGLKPEKKKRAKQILGKRN